MIRSSRFRIVRPLGSGAEGVVYEAFDSQIGASVALKTIPRSDAASLLALKQELRLRAEIAHENLVHLHELVVEPDGSAVLAMELVEGLDLVAHASCHPDDRWTITKQLFEALATLHESGVVHRDVKPSNVLVTAPSRVVLLDLGLARVTRESGRRDRGGTLRYMAPEQLIGEGASPASDVYAAGLCLFEALAGRAPFETSGQELVLERTLRHPPSLASIAPHLEPTLAELIDACLVREPSRRPSAGELVDRLEGGGRLPRARAPFVGRESELAQLEAVYRRVLFGGSEGIRVSGAAGLGKSTLIERFLESRSDERVLVLRGRCQPLATRSFAAVDECLDDLARWWSSLDAEEASAIVPPSGREALLRAFPVFGLVDPLRDERGSESSPEEPQDVEALASALAAVFHAVRRTTAVVLWIDDAQWADDDGLRIVRTITAPVDDGHGAMLILSHRPLDELEGSPLARHLRRFGLDDVELRPLAPSEAASWIDARAPEMGDARDGLVRASGGHPLLLSELVRRAPHVGLTNDVLELITRRVADLDPEARRLLETLCVAEAPVSRAALRGLGSEATIGRIRSLCAMDLTRQSRSQGRVAVEPHHAKVREAVRRTLTEARSLELHELLLTAVSGADGGEPSERLPHLLALGRRDEARRCAVDAAGRAETAFAFERAASLYALALELDHEPEDAKHLRLRCAECFVDAGRGALAAAEMLKLAEVCPADATMLHARAGEQLLRSGHFEEGMRTMRSALERVGVSPPRSTATTTVEIVWQRTRLSLRRKALFSRTPLVDATGSSATRLDVLWRAASALSLVEPLMSNALASRHLVECLDRSDRRRQSHALALEAGIRSSLGGPSAHDEAYRLLDRASGYLETCGDPLEVGLFRICEATVAYFEYRFRDVLTLTGDALECFSGPGRGATWEMAHGFSFHLTSLAYVGDVDRLRRERRRALAWADRRDDRFLSTGLRLGMPILAELIDGGAQSCLDDARLAMAPWPASPFHLFHYLEVVGTCMAEMALGRSEQAWAFLVSRWSPLSRAGYLRLPFTHAELTFLRARIALSLPRTTKVSVEREVRDARRALGRSVMPQRLAFLESIDAAVRERTGDRIRAADSWKRAADEFDRLELLGHRDAALTPEATTVGSGERDRRRALLTLSV